MRKGRSQRKARASLSPRTKAGRPQVVIGVTAQRADSSDNARRSEVDAQARSGQTGEGMSAAEIAKPTLEMLAEPTLEMLAEPTLELAEDAAPAVETPTDEAPTTDETPTTDENSIPPVSDMGAHDHDDEPIAEEFFSEGELGTARVAAGDEHDHEHEWADVVARTSHKSRPEVVERRARLAKYVRWAVGGAAVLCLAALGRTLVVPATHATAPAVSSMNALSASPAQAHTTAPEEKAASAAVTTTPAPDPAPTTPAEPAKAAEPAPTAAAATAEHDRAEPARVEAPKVDVPKGEPTAPTSDKTALEEKNDARRALERGKAADAIAAGERSVALDPTDGEAWLLLGAAYQDKGNMAEARRAYTACAKEGKRGPIGECRAMLR